MNDSNTTPRYTHESNVQSSTLSGPHNLLEFGLNKIRAMTQTPTARTAALSAIGEEIDTSKGLTRALFSSRNTLATISSLSPELLARIFRFCALVEPPWSGVQKLGWIRVTHVCQHWHQVALDDSSLWASIVGVFPSTEWISEALVRARDAPLIFDTLNPEVLYKIPPHMSHTRKLRLPRLSERDSQVVREICASEAPGLEYVELGISDASSITFRELAAGMTLFKGHAPKLRSFTTFQITIPWSLVPRGQLTQLRFIFPRQTSTQAISSLGDLNQLFDLLINSPELEILSLEFCLPSVLSQVSHGELIHFPRLSRLCLGGTTSRVTNFLKRLKLPSSATLHLLCISEGYSNHLILPLISAHFHNPAPVEFKSFRVTIDCHERLMMGVAASTSPSISTIYHSWVPEDYMDIEPELTLSFYYPPVLTLGHSGQGDILRQLCSMLAISNLKFLSISSCDQPRRMSWYDFFQHCNKITTIQASGFGTGELLWSLAPPKSTNVTSETQVTSTVGACAASPSPFPKLTTLLLEDHDLNLKEPEVWHPSDVLYDILADTLRRRKENKTPLKTLCIDRCVIDTKQVNSLQKLVWEVRWDGDEGPSASDDEWWDDDDYSSTQSGTQLEHLPGTTQDEWDWTAE